jgi:hypothetical protein
VTDPVFLAILDEIKARIAGISPPNYHFGIGHAVWVEGVQPIPDEQKDENGIPLPGSVVIDPGDISIPEDAESRTPGGVLKEALFDRSVRIVIVLSIGDKDGWLAISERIGQDLRRAMGKMPANINDFSVTDWRILGVKSIAQTDHACSRPEPGSRVLLTETVFRLRYVER